MSGLKGYVAMKHEAAYGTAVVPTQATEVSSETLDANPQFAQSQQVRRGTMAPQASRRQKTSEDAAGNVAMEAPTKGLVPWLALAHPGAIAAAVETAVGSGSFRRRLLHGRPDWDAKSASVVVGRPQEGSSVTAPFTYLGCINTGYTVTLPGGSDFVTAQFDMDSREERVDIAEPAALTYPADLGGFVIEQAELLLDTVEPVALIRSGSYTAGFPMDTGRRGFGTQGKKRRPHANGAFAGTATFQCDFEDLTFVNAAKQPNALHLLELTLRGIVEISAGVFPIWRTQMLLGYNAGVSPNIGGADRLSQELGFTILDRSDLDAPIVHEVESAEAVVTL